MQVNWAVDATVSCGYQPSQPIHGPTPTPHMHTHTHTHVRPQQCSWHPLTIWNWFGTSFCGRRCQLPDATVSVSSCIGNMRDPKVSFNLLCGEFLFRHWRRAANQNQKGNWQFNCRAGDGAGGEEGCTMQRPITYADAACQAVLLHEHPYFPTCSLPSFLPAFACVFFRVNSFFFSHSPAIVIDGLTCWPDVRATELTSWPLDQLNRLTERWQIDASFGSQQLPVLSSSVLHVLPFHLHSFARFELSFL